MKRSTTQTSVITEHRTFSWVWLGKRCNFEWKSSI